MITICKGCEQPVSGHTTRLKSHANHCSLLHQLPCWVPAKCKTVVECFRTPKEDIEFAVAKLVLTTNLPFCWVDNPATKEFLRTVFNGRDLVLSRRTLVRKFLPRLHDAAVKGLKSQFCGTSCTLQVDGWSTDQNVPVLGFAMGGRLVHLEITEEAHTTDNLTHVVENVIASVEADYGVRVAGIVTDAASNMNAMRNRLADNGVPGWHCQAHQLNLCVVDYFKDANRSRVCDIGFQDFFYISHLTGADAGDNSAESLQEHPVTGHLPQKMEPWSTSTTIPNQMDICCQQPEILQPQLVVHGPGCGYESETWRSCASAPEQCSDNRSSC